MSCLSMCSSIWLFVSPNSYTHPIPNYLTKLIRTRAQDRTSQPGTPCQGLQASNSRPILRTRASRTWTPCQGLQAMRDMAMTSCPRGPGPDTISKKLYCAYCQTRFMVASLQFFLYLNLTMNQIKCLLKFAKWQMAILISQEH